MKNHSRPPESFQICTWFGLKVVIEIGNGFWHKTGISSFVIPHPPLVNALLRLGLPPSEKHRLSVIDKFGHWQTLPIFLLYTLILIFLLLRSQPTFLTWIIAIVSIRALWEIVTEIYTIFHTDPLYALYYREISLLPRLLFWVIMSAFLIVGRVMLWL